MHLVLVAALLMVACGDTSDAPATAAPIPEDRVEVDVPTPVGFAYVIDPVDALPLDAHALTTMPVRVVLRDAETREAVGEKMLGFELVQAADAASSLESMTALTDAAGRASVNLRLGPEMGTALVRVTHPEAAELLMEIHVGAPREGTIRVDIVDPTTTLDISPYRITFFELAEFGCNAFVPRTRLDNSIRETHTADTAPVDVEGFTSGEYTVVAEALGQNGLILGGGCVDFVEVVAGQTTAVTVPLELYPGSPSGTYEVSGDWDISAAVAASNNASGTLVNVIDFMANPGASIYSLVMTEIEDAIDFPIGILLGLTGVQQQVVDTINDALFQFAGIETFVAVANDLSNMLHNLQVTSILTIEKTDTEFNFHGHEEWTALTIDWTWRCQQNPTMMNCQQYVVDLTGTGAAAAAVSYDWNGYVDGYDKLLVGSHSVHLDVGRLQMYLLEQVIIPDLTGGAANSLGGALAHWVDCDNLAAQALGNNDICDPSGLFCLGDTLIEGACVAAMNQVAAFITGPIVGQDVIADMELSGKATLVDDTPNGIADRLIDGQTEGVLSNSTEPVTATWTAVRVN